MALHDLIRLRRHLPQWLQHGLTATVDHASQLLLAIRVGKARPVAPAGKRVIVAGYFQSMLGIGSSVRLLAAALAALGYQVERLDFSGVLVQCDWGQPPPPPRTVLEALPADMPIVFVLNPPHLRQALLHLGRRCLARRYRIGYFAWELPQAPPRWVSVYPYVHEVWGVSRFVSNALSTETTKVLPVPNPLFTQAIGRSRRAALGLTDDQVIILSAFDIRSSAARKNAAGNIAAFKQAFTPDDDRVHLLLKIAHGDHASQAIQAIKSQLEGWPNIELYEQKLSDDDMLDLIASCDIHLSLHRAEGFGLALAESMRAGKVVIATNWSGNLDFMSSADSVLVPYEFTPVQDPQNIYRQAAQIWAEPDLDFAAKQLRLLASNPALLKEIGCAAGTARNASFTKDLFAACLSKSKLPPPRQP